MKLTDKLNKFIIKMTYCMQTRLKYWLFTLWVLLKNMISKPVVQIYNINNLFRNAEGRKCLSYIYTRSCTHSFRISEQIIYAINISNFTMKIFGFYMEYVAGI